MPANALVQTRIDPDVNGRAAAALEEEGITVSDALRILLTRTANEGALPFTQANMPPRTMFGFVATCRKLWMILDRDPAREGGGALCQTPCSGAAQGAIADAKMGS
jgi:addiction module RelB/DinJ family antitoxin